MLVVGEETVVKLYRARATRPDGLVERTLYLTTRAGVSSFKGWVTKVRRTWCPGMKLAVDVVEIPDDMWTVFIPEAETLSKWIHVASEGELEHFRLLVNRLAAEITSAGLKLLLDDTVKVPR